MVEQRSHRRSPGHDMLLELIARLPANVERQNPSAGNTVKSGPQFFTPIARRHKITEYPQRYFYPYGYNQLERGGEEYPDSYAIHHWNHRRTMNGQHFVTV